MGRLETSCTQERGHWSPDLAVVDMLTNWIAAPNKGKLVGEDTGDAVLGSPREPHTRRLLASLRVPDPDAQAVRRAKWEAPRVADASL